MAVTRRVRSISRAAAGTWSDGYASKNARAVLATVVVVVAGRAPVEHEVHAVRPLHEGVHVPNVGVGAEDRAQRRHRGDVGRRVDLRRRRELRVAREVDGGHRRGREAPQLAPDGVARVLLRDAPGDPHRRQAKHDEQRPRRERVPRAGTIFVESTALASFDLTPCSLITPPNTAVTITEPSRAAYLYR